MTKLRDEMGARGRARGVASIEFLVASGTVVLPLVIAILELGQLVVAKQTLEVAITRAARAGAVEHGDLRAMRTALGRGLSALQMGGSDAEALARAIAEAHRPDRVHFELWTPTAASFTDFGVRRGAHWEISNVWPPSQTRRGAASGQTLLQANHLGLRVGWCRTLLFPLLLGTLGRLALAPDAPAFDRACLAQGGWPVRARYLIHAQSPLRREALGL